MKVDIHTADAKKNGQVELNDAVFGIKEVRKDILQRMVKYQLAKRRAGTHKTQSRGEVSVTHSKIYKQKGTGQARHGAKNAPIFRGGGHAHNRLPRDYEHDLTKKFRALALRHALSAKANAGEIIVLEAAALKQDKTGAVAKSLAKLSLDNVLIITGATVDEKFARAARNIPNVDVLPNMGLNVYDMLRRKKLVLTPDAVEAIHTRFKGAKKIEAAAPTKKRAAKSAKTEAKGAAA
jgi:large subunit ribosomal protein L4